MSLVVVQRQHRVVASDAREVEHAVGRHRAADLQAARAGGGDGGFQGFNFLTAEHAVFAAMGVERGDRQMWLLEAQLAQRLHALVNAFGDEGFGHQSAGAGQ